LSRPQGHRAAGRIRSIEKSNDLIGSRNLKVEIIIIIVAINKTKIFPIDLYECKTWHIIVQEERRFRVFENKVLRRKFGP
jgi:hypothetical protein